MIKVCKQCGAEKHISAFRWTAGSDGVKTYEDECIRCANDNWLAERALANILRNLGSGIILTWLLASSEDLQYLVGYMEAYGQKAPQSILANIAEITGAQ